MNATGTTRLLRVNLTLIPNIMNKALATILINMVKPIMFEPSPENADLIVFDDVKKIEKGFDTNKWYAYLTGMPGQEKNPTIPANVSVFPISEAVTRLISLITELEKSLPINDHVESLPEEQAPLRRDALRILVIDDTPKHILNAKKTLTSYHLTTTTTYEDVMELLAKEHFDVVLTDLHLPMSSKTLSPSAFKLGELVPYGILLMIEAARRGALWTAVVTDLNHHSDPFSAAFDHFSRFSINIEGGVVSMLHARVTEDGKDWLYALNRCLGIQRRLGMQP